MRHMIWLRHMLWRGVLLLMGAGLLMACAATPAVDIAPGTLELGEIPADAPVTATVQVRNDGGGTLRITGVRTSCGCTTATLADTDVAAGAVTDLQITFDPQAHPGLYGPLFRLVYLSTNDPERPEVEIPVNVHVLDPGTRS